MLARIYQLPVPTQTGYREAVRQGIDLAEYREVFGGIISCSDVEEVPDVAADYPRLFGRLLRPIGRSDIVEVLAPVSAVYYLDGRRFRKIPNYILKKCLEKGREEYYNYRRQPI